MISGNKGLPLYIAIATEIRSRITSGQWADGVKIPTQRELAAEFSTTVMTVRRALEFLEEEELIRTDHGIGMFVTAPCVGEFERERLYGFDREMGARNQRVETVVLEVPSLVASSQAAQALGYPAETLLPRIKRLRKLAGVPIVLQSSFLATRLASFLESYDPALSLYDQISATCGVAIAMTRELLVPILLDEADAAVLGRAAGNPAMLSVRLSRSGEGEALMYDEAIIAGDSFFMTTERIGKRHSYDFNFRKGGAEPLVGTLLEEE